MVLSSSPYPFSMPELEPVCGARLRGGTHDHACHGTKDHAGLHAFHCGAQWDAKDRISHKENPESARPTTENWGVSGFDLVQKPAEHPDADGPG